MKRLLFLFVTLIALVLSTQESIATTATTAPHRTIRIAAFNLYPAIFQAKDGSVQGFYVDFIKEIATREGWNIVYVNGTWSDGIARIKTNEVDVLTSVAFTNERAQFMDYGKVPLLTVWAELYVPNTSSIENIRQVKNKKIAVMKGDFNAAHFRKFVDALGIPCQLIEYENFEEVFKAISSGRVAGGVVNNTFGAAKQNDYKIRSSGIVFNPFDIFFTVAKGENQSILATLDKYLGEWRKTENSPYHQARERWSHGSASTIQVVPSWVKHTLVVFLLFSTLAVVFLVVLRIQVRRKTRELNDQLAERKKIEEILYLVNESGAVLRGDDLLARITSHLAQTLQVDYAFVGQLMPGEDRVRTKALFANGSKVPEIEYYLHGTPCENVVGKTFCYYSDRIVEQFPEDKFLIDMEAEGYAATPLWDSKGDAIGLMGVISKSALHNNRLIETALQIVATRAAQELEASSRLNELELKNFTIENIQDAVYWISSNGMFWNVNKAASVMLGYTRDELLSMKVDAFAKSQT